MSSWFELQRAQVHLPSGVKAGSEAPAAGGLPISNDRVVKSLTLRETVPAYEPARLEADKLLVTSACSRVVTGRQRANGGGNDTISRRKRVGGGCSADRMILPVALFRTCPGEYLREPSLGSRIILIYGHGRGELTRRCAHIPSIECGVAFAVRIPGCERSRSTIAAVGERGTIRFPEHCQRRTEERIAVRDRPVEKDGSCGLSPV